MPFRMLRAGHPGIPRGSMPGDPAPLLGPVWGPFSQPGEDSSGARPWESRTIHADSRRARTRPKASGGSVCRSRIARDSSAQCRTCCSRFRPRGRASIRTNCSRCVARRPSTASATSCVTVHRTQRRGARRTRCWAATRSPTRPVACTWNDRPDARCRTRQVRHAPLQRPGRRGDRRRSAGSAKR